MRFAILPRAHAGQLVDRFPGQALIVSIGAEVRDGDFVVVQTTGHTYARRVGVDRADTTQIALESLPSTNSRVPPTHFVQRSTATLSKITGVLFDDTAPAKSNIEAIPATKFDILAQVQAAAVISGDSAFPVARDRGHVLLSAAQDVSGLSGRIAAAVTRCGRGMAKCWVPLPTRRMRGLDQGLVIASDQNRLRAPNRFRTFQRNPQKLPPLTQIAPHQEQSDPTKSIQKH